jgi:hypothetical protein
MLLNSRPDYLIPVLGRAFRTKGYAEWSDCFGACHYGAALLARTTLKSDKCCFLFRNLRLTFVFLREILELQVAIIQPCVVFGVRMRTDFRRQESAYLLVSGRGAENFSDLEAIRRQQQLKKLLTEIATLTQCNFGGIAKVKS